MMAMSFPKWLLLLLLGISSLVCCVLNYPLETEPPPAPHVVDPRSFGPLIEGFVYCPLTDFFNGSVACVPENEDVFNPVNYDSCFEKGFTPCVCRLETKCHLAVVHSVCTFSCMPNPEFTKDLNSFENRVVRHDGSNK